MCEMAQDGVLGLDVSPAPRAQCDLDRGTLVVPPERALHDTSSGKGEVTLPRQDFKKDTSTKLTGQNESEGAQEERSWSSPVDSSR